MNNEYVCSHCGSAFSRQWNLDRHVKSVHTAGAIFTCSLCGKTCKRSGNLEKHLRTCTGAPVAAVASTSRSGACPAHRFTAQRGRQSLGGAVETHTVDMGDARQLAALGDAVLSFEPAMTEYRHQVPSSVECSVSPSCGSYCCYPTSHNTENIYGCCVCW